MVSSTNKTDHHNITEILLKVMFNTIPLTPTPTTIIEPNCKLIVGLSFRSYKVGIFHVDQKLKDRSEIPLQDKVMFKS